MFPGIRGFDRTVLPQIQNAVLSRHDMLFLGLRGQGKTRMLRMLVNLLDDVIPIVAGSEINDDPYAPVSKAARDLFDARGDDCPIEWVGRDRRYHEKLATPVSRSTFPLTPYKGTQTTNLSTSRIPCLLLTPCGLLRRRSIALRLMRLHEAIQGPAIFRTMFQTFLENGLRFLGFTSRE